MTEPKGFYQPFFTPAELRDLGAVTPPLEDEIKLVRVAMRRMLKISKGQSDEEQVKSLVLLSAVSSRLASLIRTQDQLAHGKTPADATTAFLENILAEAQATWSVEP